MSSIVKYRYGCDSVIILVFSLKGQQFYIKLLLSFRLNFMLH